MVAKSSRGQATVEYIFILAFALYFGGRATGIFQSFLRSNMGQIGHYLSQNLIVGICNSKCYYGNYKNGYTP